MNNKRAIAVSIGKPRNGQPTDFAACPPIVNVYIGCDDTWSPDSEELPQHNGVTYLAMIDTGAEDTVIDSEVAQEIGAKNIHTGVIHGFEGTKQVGGVDVQIIFPIANIAFAGRAGITSFRSAGQTFDLILGRSFLSHCEFFVDGPNDRYRLNWIG